MKRLLPKFINQTQGFSLVELLVVITIIAILGTIGISVYSGAQDSAKDGKRRAEIQSIAKSIEAAKNYETGKYFYDKTTFTSDFPKALPDDPNLVWDYCIAVSTKAGSYPADATAWAVTNACPTVPLATYFSIQSVVVAKGAVGSVAAADVDLQDGTVTSWKLCARLARSSGTGDWYCDKSLNK
ncbi:MAG: prepilin-type N-terminal cleavage/methylation domain-containing protein [Candidatus Daviesbacteria bacterium]|nr:prepilin-type N-terminal cleavage/methylation domain-containing protein [Candidatus Daviesbacteria bacterium]